MGVRRILSLQQIMLVLYIENYGAVTWIRIKSLWTDDHDILTCAFVSAAAKESRWPVSLSVFSGDHLGVRHRHGWLVHYHCCLLCHCVGSNCQRHCYWLNSIVDVCKVQHFNSSFLSWKVQILTKICEKPRFEGKGIKKLLGEKSMSECIKDYVTTGITRLRNW